MKVVILKAFSCKISNLKISTARIDVADADTEKNCYKIDPQSGCDVSCNRVKSSQI